MVIIKTPSILHDFPKNQTIMGLSPTPRIKSRYSLLSIQDDLDSDQTCSDNELAVLIKDEYDDDFKYSVEPTEIRWRRHCGGVYAALGLAVTAVGLMAMAVGHWIPTKEPFVGHAAGVEVIDQGAVEFNELLASCRYVGSATFAAGVVFTVVRFWWSVIRGDRGADDGKLSVAADDGKLATAVGDRLRREHADRRRSSLHHHSLQQPPPDRHTTVRIPVSGSVENVQPDPRAIHLRFDRDS